MVKKLGEFFIWWNKLVRKGLVHPLDESEINILKTFVHWLITGK
jgi:hypothetical protein